MKNLMIVAAMVLATFTVSAQDATTSSSNAGIKVGVFATLPTGDDDAVDTYSFGIGLDVKYLFAVADDFSVGFATGYTNYFSKNQDVDTGLFVIEIDVPNAQFIPLAASAQYMIADKFSAGLDIGYALGVSEGNDGGFYYRPGVSYGVSDSVEIGLSYSGISVNDATFSTINLGVLFAL